MPNPLHMYFSGTVNIMLEPNRVFHLILAAFSGEVPSPFGHNDKHVINDTRVFIRTRMKICKNLPQIHPDRHNMKKLFSDLPDLGKS